MHADIEELTKSIARNAGREPREPRSAYSYARARVPFVREILMRRDGHERHKISGTQRSGGLPVVELSRPGNAAREPPENARENCAGNRPFGFYYSACTHPRDYRIFVCSSKRKEKCTVELPLRRNRN